jgi:hypothetical protein
MNVFLTLFGGYGLKGGNLLFHPRALAFRAPEFLLVVFGNRQNQGKGLITLLTHEVVYGHAKPLLISEIH